jgi:hypothetical protein
MTRENDGVGRFIGFFRLVDACAKPGCPVCRCLVADARRYLGTLLYEHVNDPDTRRRLRASWGFCGWHTWMLRDLADPAFGSAIIHDATTWAAALHYRLAQVAEDRNNLEMNVSGERAANMLSERMIAELRAEIRQLRDELGRPRPSESG